MEGYGFLSFARNLASSAAAHEATKRAKDTLIKQGKEVVTKAGKRALSKTAKATGDLVGQKIADKITWKPKTTKQPDQPMAQPVAQVREFSLSRYKKSSESLSCCPMFESVCVLDFFFGI